MTPDPLIIDTATKIFQDLGDPQMVNAAADDSWRPALWQALEESGLTRTWLTDELGGAGASVADGLAVARVAGTFAASIPIAETLLAAWLLGRAGMRPPDGPITVAPVVERDHITVDSHGRLSGAARRVPFATVAPHIAVMAARDDQIFVCLVESAACGVTPGHDLANDPRDAVAFDDAPTLSSTMAPAGLDRRALGLMGAAVRVAQMTGALERILDIAVGYATERVAFGRPIAKFQVIQHELAKLAGEIAAAIAACGALAPAIRAADELDERAFVEVASAKIRVGEAAREGAAIAHQVHGAIGFTEEYILHRFTRRLWSWQDDFGSESQWAARLGALVCHNGADALWPILTMNPVVDGSNRDQPSL